MIQTFIPSPHCKKSYKPHARESIIVPFDETHFIGECKVCHSKALYPRYYDIDFNMEPLSQSKVRRYD